MRPIALTRSGVLSSGSSILRAGEKCCRRSEPRPCRDVELGWIRYGGWESCSVSSRLAMAVLQVEVLRIGVLSCQVDELYNEIPLRGQTDLTPTYAYNNRSKRRQSALSNPRSNIPKSQKRPTMQIYIVRNNTKKTQS
jgi:hypothetical protein